MSEAEPTSQDSCCSQARVSRPHLGVVEDDESDQIPRLEDPG